MNIAEMYYRGGLAIEVDYYCVIDGVYRKAQMGPVNIYREGGHFYYWLDVVADDPDTPELEGPAAAGVGGNYVYKWVRGLAAPNMLGGWDPALKYTPDPDPQGPLPREMIQDLHIITYD